MIVVVCVCAAAFTAAAVVTLWRIARGPTMLDRMVALEVLIAATVGAVGLEAAVNRHTTTLPILVVLSLVGFIGSVSVARFSVREARRNAGNGRGVSS